ncbi:MAG: ferrochelatase [Alphaproteobacteria bacterium]|nr:ferrochelatase [Alphaproteobacteria bacterium]
MTPGVLVVNFGGPRNDDELEPFLAALLADVLPGPRGLARAAAGRLARLRARRVREAYRRIGFSPLVDESRRQLEAVRTALGPDAPPMALGMLFTPPSMREGLEELLAQGVTQVVVLGLFPHWSFATSGAAYDAVAEALHALGRPDLPVHYARAFFADDAYVQALGATITRAAAALDGEGPVHLVFSAHGLPVSWVREGTWLDRRAGDPYPEHVRDSVRRVVAHLGWTDPWTLAWQSRLGPVAWLSPDVRDVVDHLGAAGTRRLLVVPVSFVGEHIETLDELDLHLVAQAHEAGIAHVGRAPALGVEPAFVACLADLVRETLGRFGSYRCSRCLVPQEPELHRRRATCPSCAFALPRHLREGTAGVG